MTLKHGTVLGVTVLLLVGAVLVDVKIGFIGSLSSGTGLSALRGVEIAIEEINATGDMDGEKFVSVGADTGKDVTEGAKAYEHPVETEEVDFIISGSIDDVGLGWLPRMQKSQTPTPDTWTPYVGIIDMVVEDPETMAPYSMNIVSDEILAMLYINLSADVLKKEMGWDGVIILAGGTVSGETITGLTTETLDPVVGIETREIVTYDIGAVDFAPLFSRTQTLRADFIH